jgi:putative ABC transport system permease protein
MLHYYFLLGLRSLRRNPALTALMVLILAVGVAASVSTLTILHVMSGDPIPHKSERLFVPLIDNGPLEDYTPGEKPDVPLLTYRDTLNLLASGQGERRTAMYSFSSAIEPARRDLTAFAAEGLANTHDFFAMFELPFLYGQPWNEQDDATGTDVAVLSRPLAEKLFGNANPVGQHIRVNGIDFQITGVLGDWKPILRYYHVTGDNAFDHRDELMVPLASALRHQTRNTGTMGCAWMNTKPGFQGRIESECNWFQFWFETRSASGRAELQNYLDGYMAEQRKLGRMPRKIKAELFDVMEWMAYVQVVDNDNRLSAWLAFGFLLLCLVNTIGLLLAKFSVRASEVGIRRALGAPRREIFRQFLIEAGVIGLAGGALGLLFALGALALIGMQSRQLAVVTHMDWQMLALTFVLSVAAALLAGLLPTWRACQVTPALQLKSQ